MGGRPRDPGQAGRRFREAGRGAAAESCRGALSFSFFRCFFFPPARSPALETVAADEGAGGRPPGAPASPPLPPPRQDGSEMSPEPKPPPSPPPPPTPGREAEVVALTVAAVVESEAAAPGASGGGGRKCGSRIMLVRRIGFKPGGGASVSACEETSFPSRGFRLLRLRGALAVRGRGGCCESRGDRPARGSGVSTEFSVEKLQPGGGGVGEAAPPLSPLPLLLGLLVSGMVARARKSFPSSPVKPWGWWGGMGVTGWLEEVCCCWSSPLSPSHLFQEILLESLSVSKDSLSVLGS